MIATIDLNADLGESFGAWTLGQDAELMPHLSSANVACGFHAGDPQVIKRTAVLAREHGVSVGAHPGFPDLVGFGRRDLGASPDEVYADVLYQLGALSAFLRPYGERLHHVKAHGALYSKLHTDAAIAEAVVGAVRDFDAALPLVLLAGAGGAEAQGVAQKQGLRVVREAFPDRAYEQGGRLAPRWEAGAIVDDPVEIAARAVQMVTAGAVPTLSGSTAQLDPQTLCIHGDALHAVAAARAVRKALEALGVRIASF